MKSVSYVITQRVKNDRTRYYNNLLISWNENPLFATTYETAEKALAKIKNIQLDAWVEKLTISTEKVK